MKKFLNILLFRTTGIVFIIILSGSALLSSCLNSGLNWPPIEVVQKPRVQFGIDSNTHLILRAISGDLFVTGIDGNEAVASIEVRCPELTGRCADHFEDLDFDISRSGNNLTVSANKSLYFKGNSAVKTTLALPRADQLTVKMMAGDVNISRINVSGLDVDLMAGDLDIEVDQLKYLKVNLETGDVNIVIPEKSVAELDLDAGVGDASIKRHRINESAPRSLLVGAQIHKMISTEGAILKVDVQVGDIKLDLLP